MEIRSILQHIQTTTQSQRGRQLVVGMERTVLVKAGEELALIMGVWQIGYKLKKYMKKIIIASALSVLVLGSFVNVAEARTVRVNSGFRSNGTYVAPHYRTSPDRSRLNNWSTKGNYNPYTGKSGTRSYGSY